MILNKVIRIRNQVGIIDEESISGYNIKVMNLDDIINLPYINTQFSKHSDEFTKAIESNRMGIIKSCKDFFDDLDNIGAFDSKILNSVDENNYVKLFIFMVEKAIESKVFLTDLDTFKFKESFLKLKETILYWRDR